MAKIELGDLVKDKITGFTGITVCKTDWLYSCTRFAVQPQHLDKDGKQIESAYFDSQQLEIVEKNIIVQKEKITTKPGGPQKDPTFSRGEETR